MEIKSKLSPRLPKLPLSIYKSIKIGEAVSKDGENFSIFIGLDKKIVSQLKTLSLDKKDEELQKNTGDRKRFGEGSYSDWYKKNRIPFILVHTSTAALAVLVWFGPKMLGKKSIKYQKSKELTKEEIELPKDKIENWHTISYRAYPNFRGKGLTKKFATSVIEIYMKKFPNIKLWSGIDARNAASRKLAESLGFKILEKLSDRKENWLVMVKY